MTSEPAHSFDDSEMPSTSDMPATSKEITGKGSHFSLADVRQEMDRLWESIMNGRLSRLTLLQQTPPIDVFEKEGMVRVRADLPGIDEREIRVEVEGDDLVISGEKRDDREIHDENQYRSERTYGRFTRRISLPHGADAVKAVATFKNGVLEIDMPTKPDMGKKKIEIQVR